MNAIDTLEAKNAELQALIEDHRKQPGMQVNTLNMKLGGICDPAVNGGLANYMAFFNGEYNNDPDDDEEKQAIKRAETDYISKLQEVISYQVGDYLSWSRLGLLLYGCLI